MMYPGFNTTRLAESQAFYTKYLGFETIYEADWFVLLKRGDYELGFMRPELSAQNPLFQPAFGGGSWLAFETEDVEREYTRLKQAGAPIVTEIIDEAWGDRHFVIRDPSGIGVDIFQRMEVSTQ